MVEFNGFTMRDFQAFAKHKLSKSKYNDERKVVWRRLWSLKEELDDLMPPRMKGRVSTFYPNPHNYFKVHNIWLGYSHHKPLSLHPHLGVWVSNESIWVGLTIPYRGKKFQRRLKNYLLENKIKVLNEIQNLPIVRSTKFEMTSTNEEISSDSPNEFSEKDLQDFTDGIEPGKDYLWIDYSFNRNDRRLKARKFIRVTEKLLMSLYPLYKHALEGPDESILANLIVKRKRAEKALRMRPKIKEGKEHKLLKKYLMNHPERLGEGLQFLHEEFPFVTGDRIDLLFRDASKKLVAVEVEPKIEKGQNAGLLQAVKYKHMLAVVLEKDSRNVRAFVAAKKIHHTIKQLAKRYGVETKEIEL